MPRTPQKSSSNPPPWQDWAWLLPFCVLPLVFIPDLNDPWNAPRFALGAALLAVLLGKSIFSKSETRFQPRFLLLGGLWMGLSLLSIPFAPNLPEALWLVGIRLMAFAFILWLSQRRSLDGIPKALSLTGLIVAAWGGMELTGWIDMDTLADIPVGATGNPNLYGALMVLLMPFPLLLAVKLDWRKGIVLVAFAAMALASGSLTAMLALGVGLGAFAFFHFGKNRVRPWMGSLLLLLVVAAPILYAAMNFDGSVRSDAQSNSATERALIWRHSLDMLSRQPLIGLGPGGWKQEMLARGMLGFSTEYGGRYFTEPHNDFLWVGSESGIPAMLAYLGMLLFLVHCALHKAISTQNASLRLHMQVMAAAVLAWAVVSSFSFPLERIDLLLPFCATAAWILKAGDAPWRPPILPMRLLWAGLGLACAALCVFGTLRMQAERAHIQAQRARKARDWVALRTHASEAERPWHTIEYFSSTPMAWYQGVAHFETKDFAAAKTAFLRAHRLSPAHPHVLQNLGVAYAALGELDSAAHYLRACTEIHPDFKAPCQNLMQVYQFQGDSLKAKALERQCP